MFESEMTERPVKIRNRTLIAVRHVSFEDLDALEPIVTSLGYSVRYMDVSDGPLDLDALRKADVVVFLGGPIGVYQAEIFPFLTDEIALAKYRLDNGKPVLGLCLGAQIMASALGASVYPGPAGKELGWSPLQLTAEGTSSFLRYLDDTKPAVLHWHGDTFDLPQGATRLASSTMYENQVFSYDSHGLALQCHLEVSCRGLERWYIGHIGELMADGNMSISALREQSRHCIQALRTTRERVFLTWFASLDE